MATVEAVQAFLPGIGWVLVPTENGIPPKIINDEWLHSVHGADFRVFDEPNKNGPMYYYTRSEQRKQWFLVEA
jgi:hypothetical protein